MQLVPMRSTASRTDFSGRMLFAVVPCDGIDSTADADATIADDEQHPATIDRRNCSRSSGGSAESQYDDDASVGGGVWRCLAF